MTTVYDVLTYEFAENPQGIPNNWPAILRERDSGDTLETNWIRFNSIGDYNAYLATHSAEYEADKAAKLLAQQKLEACKELKNIVTTINYVDSKLLDTGSIRTIHLVLNTLV